MRLAPALALALALAGPAACGSPGREPIAAHEGAPPGAPARAVVPAVGSRVPAITLTTPTSTRVALADTWRPGSQAIVVFYRGFY